MKRAAAQGALGFLEAGALIGVGTGTTVAQFIEAMAAGNRLPSAAVATSVDTQRRLEAVGINVVTLASGTELSVYFDSADEIDPAGRMIKGAGGAHTMEKAVASASLQFICIVDATKLVERLGEHAPVPLEVLPGSVDAVCENVRDMGGSAVLRDGRLTDAGNRLVDVSGLDLSEPEEMELRLDAIPGVIECGLFAHRRADIVIVGEPGGSVRTYHPSPD